MDELNGAGGAAVVEAVADVHCGGGGGFGGGGFGGVVFCGVSFVVSCE